jgi:trans-2,3-dihydro-3-hydroxyanthranilate isomerase
MAAEPNHPYTILDVFTDTPLQGNPLAVFLDGESVPSRVMQATARELNLSETVFLMPGDGECDAQVRIFTPGTEVPFAGHPVLGAAVVVGSRVGLETVRLRTGSGIVPVRLRRDEGGEVVGGEMEQPIPTVAPFEPAAALLAALRVERAWLPVEVYDNGLRHVMVALGDAGEVSALRPDLAAIGELGDIGVSCFARTDAGARTRMFGVGLGVVEDPATGSAAGPLALHLCRHGRQPFGEPLEITQGVEIGRPSLLHARVDGSAEGLERVVVGGSAVVVAHGAFRLQ